MYHDFVSTMASQEGDITSDDGLQNQEKMSKSDPSSAIFMEDSVAEVNVKIKQAFCPPGIVEGNPCIAYLRLLVFPWMGSFEVKRIAECGGDK